MARLTPQEREDRDRKRIEATKAEHRARWAAKLEETKPRMTEAGVVLAEALQKKALNMRDIWLVVAGFEVEEKMAKIGERKSCQTKWFDKLAPRANPEKYPYYGVSGYAARTAVKATQFLTGSRNGYVWLTDLGYALVQWLRENFPSLAPEIGLGASKQPIPLHSLGEDVALPYPHWRIWKDWDKES